MMSFEEIRHKYDIDKKYFFKFLQLRSFIRKSQDCLLTKPFISNLEKWTSKDSLSNGAISELYNLLLSNSSEKEMHGGKTWNWPTPKQLTPD